MEKYPFAWDAVREAVFNALIHCNWADNIPIQIRIEEDVMYISNSSMLPFGWTAETLMHYHSSKPFNPDIARVFYRAGYITNCQGARIHSDKKIGCHKKCHKGCHKGNGNFSFAERRCIYDNGGNGTEIICEQKNSTKRA